MDGASGTFGNLRLCKCGSWTMREDSRRKKNDPEVILYQQEAATGFFNLWSRLSSGVVDGYDPVWRQILT